MLSTPIGLAVALSKGAGIPVVTLDNQTIDQSVVDPTDLTGGYRLENSADSNKVESRKNAVYTQIGNWIPSGADPNLFEHRMTMVSGTNFSGDALATWLDANTAREWTLTRTTVGTTTGTGTIETRLKSTGVVQDSASITITSTVDP